MRNAKGCFLTITKKGRGEAIIRLEELASKWKYGCEVMVFFLSIIHIDAEMEINIYVVCIYTNIFAMFAH